MPEKIYLGWAHYDMASKGVFCLPFKHKEWINLHAGPEFEAWVEFLRSELERVASTTKNREDSRVV